MVAIESPFWNAILPDATPPALERAFGRSPQKQAQWRAFLRKSGIQDVDHDFERVVRDVALFLTPVITAVRAESVELTTWAPGGPWQVR